MLLTYFEQTGDFVGVSDPWGRVLYLNPAAQKRLGVVEVDDLNLADLFPAETFAVYYDVIRPALLRSGAWSGEILVNVAGSDAIPMHVSTVARIGPGGEVDGSVMIGHEPDAPRPSVAAAGDAERDAPVSIAAFRLAMSHGEVVPYAQPVVDLASRLVMGYRGMARWNHRRLGQLEAKQFIEMISGTSSASGLDLYVAREVAAMLLLTARVRGPAHVHAGVAPADRRRPHRAVPLGDRRTRSTCPCTRCTCSSTVAWSSQAPPTLPDALRSLADAGVGFVLTGVEDASDVGYAADNGFREVHLSRGLTQAAASDGDAAPRRGGDRGACARARDARRRDRRDRPAPRARARRASDATSVRAPCTASPNPPPRSRSPRRSTTSADRAERSAIRARTCARGGGPRRRRGRCP